MLPVFSVAKFWRLTKIMNVLPVILILTTLFVERCLGAVEFVDPPSGSVIANFEGTLNSAILRCNISNGEIQIGTQWSIENYRGNPALQTVFNAAPHLFEFGGDLRPGSTTDTFLNRITVLNFTSDLDNAIVYCGTGVANFTLRIYRPPNVQNHLLIRILERNETISINLRQEPAAFPEPTLYTWNKDGQPLRAGLSRTYSTIIFDNVRRADAGNYTVSATNFILPGSPGVNQVGVDTGSFYLDVIYGPSLAALGPSQYFVLLGDPLSLVCGTGLDSNPQPTITWTVPNGTTIMDSPRYSLNNGSEIVRLNFTRTILSDAGIWRCDIRTESDQYTVSDGSLFQINSTVIGELNQHDIELIIVAPPGQPHTLFVKESEATSFQICWEAPFQSDSPVSYYSIRACNHHNSTDKVVTNTIVNETSFIVTGLLPGTTYELTVVAVSRGGEVVAKSPPSDPVIKSTGFTVPAVTCNAPVSSNGVITITWSYIHTGGLPLTNVYMSYNMNTTERNPISISISSVDTTSVTVIADSLEAGFEYTFNITASNTYGSSSISCGRTLYVLDSTPAINTAAVAGGVVGGLVLLVIGIFALIIFIVALRKRGKGAISGKAEVVYEDPDDLQLQDYRPKNDGDIELKECPAYEKPSEQPDIELVDCPAYMEKKKYQNITLEECPAYGHLASDH